MLFGDSPNEEYRVKQLKKQHFKNLEETQEKDKIIEKLKKDLKTQKTKQTKLENKVDQILKDLKK